MRSSRGHLGLSQTTADVGGILQLLITVYFDKKQASIIFTDQFLFIAGAWAEENWLDYKYFWLVLHVGGFFTVSCTKPQN